jgi:hypothetical protein
MYPHLYPHPTSPSLETAFPYPGSALIVASTVTRFALPVNQVRRSSSHPACISLQPQSQPCEAALEAFSNNSRTALPDWSLCRVSVYCTYRYTGAFAGPSRNHWQQIHPFSVTFATVRPVARNQIECRWNVWLSWLVFVLIDLPRGVQISISPLALSSGSIGWQDGYSYTPGLRIC